MKIPIQPEERCRELYERYGGPEAARVIGVSASTFYTWLAYHHIETKPQGHNGRENLAKRWRRG